MVSRVSGNLKILLVSVFALALGASSVSAQSKPASPVAAVQQGETQGYSSLPDVKLTSRILFQLIASEIALQRGEIGAAYQTYLTLASETGDPRIAERAAQIALAANAPNDFRRAVKEWIRLAPDNRKAQQAYIASGFISGQFGEITSIAANYLANSTDKGADILKLQTELALTKNKPKALSFFKQVTAKYSSLYQTQLGLARLEALNGNFAAADKYARAAYKLAANEDTVLTLSGVLMRSNPKEAEQLLSDFLKGSPKSSRIRDAYSQLLLQNKDFDKLASLQKSYREDARYQISLAIGYVQLSQIDKAKEILEEVVKRLEKKAEPDENLDRAYLLLSDIASESKDYSTALHYASLVKGKLKGAAAFQAAGIYTKQSEWDKALGELNTINAEDNPEVLEEAALLRARILLETKGEETALEDLNKSLILSPYSKSLHYEAAMLSERVDNIKDAEFHLKRAIEIDPTFANAYNSLGYTLLERTKRIKEAAKYINQAYELDPHNPYILDSKGWLAFKQRQYSKAIEFLSEALKLQEELDIYLHLAEVQWTMGEKKLALETLNKAAAQWPEASEIEALRKRLKMPNETP